MKKLVISLMATMYFIVSGGVAFAGDLTMPLGTTGSSSTAPYTNSWFDHDGALECASGGTCNGSLTIYDGSLPSGNVSQSGCTIRVNCYDGHAGIDFEASCDTPVYASMSGTVSVASFASDGYGNRIRIWNSGSGYSAMTAHMDTMSVSVNSSVYRGQLIGYSGNTGTVACHLHFATYTASTGGTAVDPSGWTSTGSDPRTSDIGYLWGTRVGVLSSSSAVSVKEPYLASGFSSSIATSASSFALGDSRVGYISSGSAFVKDGDLGSAWHEVWDSSGGSASKILVEGRRIVILLSNGTVYAKDGSWDAGWYGGTSLATSVTDVYTSKNWTAIRIGNELYIKAGLGDGWTDIAGGVIGAGTSRSRIVALFYDGSVYAKEGGYTSGYSWNSLTSGSSAIAVGGGRICTINSGTAYCKEANLNDTWTTIYTGASLIRANDARIAIKDSSNGYLKVLEGSITNTNSGWITASSNGTDSDIEIN
jgi:nitrite reductase/ring-hydroxylating ferredoxin subunit